MSSSLPDEDVAPAPTAQETTLLTRRVHAVQQVTEMASGGAVRLLGHVRQLETTLDQLTRQVESLPSAARISLLSERMESLQAMLDWLTTRSAPNRSPADFSGIQTRLSQSRIALADAQAEIQQAAILARDLRETRARISGLVCEVETLESTQARAEALLLESRDLSARMEREQSPGDPPPE